MAEKVYYIDAATDADTMTSQIKHYLAGISGTDPDFLKDASVASSVIEYCPIYKVRTNYTANWTASFGYKRQVPEKYFDSSGNEKTRYRTETDWRPASGQSEGAVEYFLCAADDYSEHIQQYISASSIPSLQVAATEIEAENTHRFNRPQDDKFVDDRRLLERDRVLNDVRRHRQGDVDRDWSVDWKASRKQIRCLLPIATVTLDWQGKTFTYTHGCWAGAEISGDNPPKGRKVSKLIVLMSLSLLLGFTSCIKGGNVPDGPERNAWYLLLFISFIAAGLFASLDKWRDEVRRRPYMKPEDIKLSIFDKIAAFWEKIEKSS